MDAPWKLPNALVQLQALYHHCGVAAPEKWLSAATFVRPRGSQAGTCTRSLMCLRFATMVNVITTSSDHELHLPTCTAVHAPS